MGPLGRPATANLASSSLPSHIPHKGRDMTGTRHHQDLFKTAPGSPTGVTVTVVVQSTVTSGLADVFMSFQALQATAETQASLGYLEEDPWSKKTPNSFKNRTWFFNGVTFPSWSSRSG